MKNILFIYLLIFIFISCNNDNVNKSNFNPNTSNSSEINNMDFIINSKIKDYIKDLSKKEYRFVDSVTCSNTDKMLIDYENGILNYEFNLNNLTKITGDLNGDNKSDVIVYYICYNCWNGQGGENYLENFFFLTTIKNTITVDEQLTFIFKRKLNEYINKNFGEETFYKTQKEFSIHSLKFNQISNRIIYGEFSINTDNCYTIRDRCFNGKFEFDSRSNSIKMTLNAK
jgi:hypothetical protein